MKKEMLVLAMFIGCCSGACQGAMSRPAEDFETVASCQTELQTERALNEADVEELQECYAVQNASGVSVETEQTTEAAETVVYDELRYKLSVALAELAELKQANSICNAQLDGIQEEYSKLEVHYSRVASDFNEYQKLYDTHQCGVYQTIEIESE